MKNIFFTLTFLVFAPGIVLAQQQCESIFADSSLQILKEIAQLKVNIETAPSKIVADMLKKLYNNKYAAAERAQIDLSLLPRFVKETRGKKFDDLKDEEARKEAARDSEYGIEPFQFHEVPVQGQVSSYDSEGNFVTVVEGAKIHIVSLKEKKVLWDLVESQGVQRAVLSKDGQLLAAYFHDGHGKSFLNIWDVQSQRKIKALTVRDEIGKIEFSADAKKLLTWDGSTAFIWNLDAIADKLDTTTRMSSIMKFFGGKKDFQKFPSLFEPRFSVSGKRIVTFEGEEQHATSALLYFLVVHSETSNDEWQPERKTKIGYHQVQSMSPDGTKIVISKGHFTRDRGHAIAILDATTGKQLFNLQDPFHTGQLHAQYFVSDVKFSSDGSKIFTAGTLKGRDRKDVAIVWDAHTGEVLNIITDTVDQNTHWIMPSSDGNLLFTYGLTPGFQRIAALWWANGMKFQDLQHFAEKYTSMGVIASPTRPQFITFEREQERKKQRLLIWEQE